MKSLKSILIAPILVATLLISNCGKIKNTTEVTKLRRAPQNCEEALQGSDYRYIRDSKDGLIFQSCIMKNGKPVVYEDFKDKGYQMTHYW